MNRNVTFSIAIMAHPSRREWVNETLKQLEAEGRPDVLVTFDAGGGIVRNCGLAWCLREPTYDYHLVLQDDAQLCKNFVDRARETLERAEYAGGGHMGPVSFYCGNRESLRKSNLRAMRTNGHIYGPLRWGLAVCLPNVYVQAMLRFYNEQSIPQDDARIKRWLVDCNLPVYFPLPSLVEHRTGPSLVGDPGLNRKAFAFIDDISSQQVQTLRNYDTPHRPTFEPFMLPPEHPQTEID